MNGDISLSDSLGGLRIANPDDEAALSPTSSTDSTIEHVPDSDTRSLGQRSTSTIKALQSGSSSSFEPVSAKEGISGQQAYQEEEWRGQRQADHRLVGSTRNHPDSHNLVPTYAQESARPASALYHHSNGSSASTRERGPYPPDLGAHQQSGLGRTASRSASNPTDQRYLTRESSQRGQYRKAQQYQQTYGTSDGIPTRRLSQRGGPTQPSGPHSAAPLSGSPYSTEGGPLRSSEDWYERGAAVSTRQVIDSNGNQTTRVVKKGVRDFNFGRTLGEGSYSTVLAATDRHTGREYAVKVLDKRHIIKEKKVKYVNIEKDTLNRLTEHPGIVRLYYTFQDERSLYFVLDLASGGELLAVLKKTGTFDEECAQYYAAQLLDSIAYMHSRGIIHRDLKPENVLLDSSMHTKITDFGTAKILDISSNDPGGDTPGKPSDGLESDRAKSFVGTAEYVSPELLTDKNACKASDLWALGCIIFQLLAGRPPFKAGNEYQTFQKIVALDYQFPEGFSPVAKDLIQRLLVLDPTQRLSIDDMKQHAFFEGVQWGRGLWRTKAPKLKPYQPPPAEPIKLNGLAHSSSVTVKSAAKNLALNPSTAARPHLRAVTELPPPSQLDIDWSPVLTRPNERILKMANLVVTSMSSPVPSQLNATTGAGADNPKRFSRFFGGGNAKKKQRLVMITSTARIIVVPAGGDEKKAKTELSLMGQGVSCRSYQDARGLTAFCVDTRDKQYTFEDPSASTSDPGGSRYSTQEWMEKIEWAKELAVMQSAATSYAGESAYNDVNSALPSPATSTTGSEGTYDQVSSRNVLRKDTDEESVRSGRRHRFSKRHSKNGLAAVF